MSQILDFILKHDYAYNLEDLGYKYIYIDGKKTRYIADINGNIYSTNYNHTKTIKKLVTRIGKNGYMYIMLPYRKKRKNFILARLIAKTFLPIPQKYIDQGLTESDLEVNHIDGNKLNNEITNLEWCTPEENKTHASIHRLLKYGEDVNSSVLTEKDVRHICELLQEGTISRLQISKDYNVDFTTIDSIYKRKTWTIISKEYNFDSYNPEKKLKTGEANNLSRITEKQAREICKLLEENELTLREIAEKVNTTTNTVSKIRTGVSWKSLSKEYDFKHYNIDGRKRYSGKSIQKNNPSV